MSSVLLTPSGQSHRTCKATVGQTPVSRWTWPASLNFSSVVVAAAGWMNFPKRVPVLAKPQDGSSMRKDSSALKIVSLLRASIGTSLRNRRVQSFPYKVTNFFRGACSFAVQNAQHNTLNGQTGQKAKALEVSPDLDLSAPEPGLEQQFCHAESFSVLGVGQAEFTRR